MTDETPATVGIVVVSHSSELAEATVQLVARLANLEPDRPPLLAAGGMEDGSIGTDAVRLADALTAADRGLGVVVRADLGSAVRPTPTPIDDILEPALGERIRVSSGPIVEGTFIGAVQASLGDSLEDVLAAANEAGSMDKLGDAGP
jgi:dihydroxyacetone kinase DhaKLM complex PTS-EIIA-like component DhaM